MTALQHGGRLLDMVAQYGGNKDDWIDVSTGISPYSYPVTQPPMDVWQRLPQISDTFTQAAAQYYGIEGGLPVAGSQSVIQLLPRLCAHHHRSPYRVWLPKVGYKEHQKAWQNASSTVCFYTDLPPLSAITTHDVVVLINPNNPTGFMTNHDQLEALLQRLEQLMGILIIDEAFMDCTPEHSMLKRPARNNLLVLRSAGKFFGLAGIRMGMLFAPTQWRDHCSELLGPWTVNGPALHVMSQAFADKTWQQRQRETLMQDSAWLHRTLGNHLHLTSSGTGLFRTIRTPLASQWFTHLCQQKVYVRLCDEKDALRFGLPSPAQRQRLETAIASLATS